MQVPRALMPVPDADYETMNCSSGEFADFLQGLPEDVKHYVVNTTHRLAEVDWIGRNLNALVNSKQGPFDQAKEGHWGPIVAP